MRFARVSYPYQARDKNMAIWLPEGTLPRIDHGLSTQSALIPLIPPMKRPKRDLKHYHILFEADWQNPPADPFLLKALGKGLYAILAHWDLTPLEQAILRQR